MLGWHALSNRREHRLAHEGLPHLCQMAPVARRRRSPSAIEHQPTHVDEATLQLGCEAGERAWQRRVDDALAHPVHAIAPQWRRRDQVHPLPPHLREAIHQITDDLLEASIVVCALVRVVGAQHWIRHGTARARLLWARYA